MRIYAKEENGLTAYDVLSAENAANNLTTKEAGYVLDARQGKALRDLLKTGAETEMVFGSLIIAAAANTYTSVTVTWEMSNNPRAVLATAAVWHTMVYYRWAAVFGPTATGCTINLWNGGVAENIRVHYLAVR